MRTDIPEPSTIGDCVSCGLRMVMCCADVDEAGNWYGECLNCCPSSPFAQGIVSPLEALAMQGE